MRGWASAALAAICVSSWGCAPASWAADALLHPPRRPVNGPVSRPAEPLTLTSGGVVIKGWRFIARGERRGTIIFLHGVADNRASGVGTADRFLPRGFDVIAYDSRAHGESGGDACTYGFYEKQDLRRVIDTIDGGPIVVIGHSLGAAVALQAAADDARISAVVAVETFSDLRTIARERAPFVLTKGTIQRAFALAEERGRFRVDDVSPVAAARRISAPVLMIHGADDRETRADHSRRVFEALRGEKRLIIVPGAGHNRSLSGDVWTQVEEWIDRVASPAAAYSARSATDGSTRIARRAGT